MRAHAAYNSTYLIPRLCIGSVHGLLAWSEWMVEDSRDASVSLFKIRLMWFESFAR